MAQVAEVRPAELVAGDVVHSGRFGREGPPVPFARGVRPAGHVVGVEQGAPVGAAGRLELTETLDT